MSTTSLQRRVTAEFLGTLFLFATVIGSGIMAERLAGANVALALLANTIATGAILVALIFTFGAVSGAHFNPAVTVADALEHGMSWRGVPAYIGAQCLGGLTGTAVAHLMFGLSLFSLSRHARSGGAQSSSQQRTIRSRCLYHRCVLVHFFNIVRKPSSDGRQSGLRYIRRNTST